MKLLEHKIDSHCQYIFTNHSFTNPTAPTSTTSFKALLKWLFLWFLSISQLQIPKGNSQSAIHWIYLHHLPQLSTPALHKVPTLLLKLPYGHSSSEALILSFSLVLVFSIIYILYFLFLPVSDNLSTSLQVPLLG